MEQGVVTCRGKPARPGLSPDRQRLDPGQVPCWWVLTGGRDLVRAVQKEAFRGFETEDGSWAFHTISVAGTLAGKPQAGGQCGGRGAFQWGTWGTVCPHGRRTGDAGGRQGRGLLTCGGSRAHTHGHTHVHTQANTGPSMHSDRNTHTHSHTHILNSHARTGPSTFSDRNTYAHRHTHGHARDILNTHIYVGTHTHPVTHIPAHTHANTGPGTYSAKPTDGQTQPTVTHTPP